MRAEARLGAAARISEVVKALGRRLAGVLRRAVIFAFASMMVVALVPASVSAQRIRTVRLAPESPSLIRGDSVQLTATVIDRAGNVLTGRTLTWTSSGSAVRVTQTGRVFANGAGRATVTASTGNVRGSVTVTVTAPTTPEPIPLPTSEPVVPPSETTVPSGAAGMVFASDFGTATGTSSSALLDGGKSRRWNGLSTGNTGVLRIESASAAGLTGEWPSANVRRVIGIATSTPAQSSRLTNGNGVIPELTTDGQDVFYRWYLQVPDTAFPATTDNTNHNIENGNVGQNWMFRTVIQNDGTYLAGFEFEGTAWPNNRWYPPAALRKGETYRIELRIVRRSATTFQPQARIYSYSGALLYDDDDFRNVNRSASFANAPLLTFVSVDVMDELQAGINGIAVDVARSFTYWFDGAYAVCTDNWCGPYAAAEATF